MHTEIKYSSSSASRVGLRDGIEWMGWVSPFSILTEQENIIITIFARTTIHLICCPSDGHHDDYPSTTTTRRVPNGIEIESNEWMRIKSHSRDGLDYVKSSSAYRIFTMIPVSAISSKHRISRRRMMMTRRIRRGVIGCCCRKWFGSSVLPDTDQIIK